MPSSLIGDGECRVSASEPEKARPYITLEPTNPEVHRLQREGAYEGRSIAVKRPPCEKVCTLRSSGGPAKAFGSIARAVAKKVRTPPPPKRPIQAPQRRQDPRRGLRGRGNLWSIIAVLALVAAAAIAAALYFALRGKGSSNAPAVKAKPPAVNYNALPGVRKTKAPWAPEYAHLADRLLPLRLKALGQEALVYHIHQHLDLFLNGKPLTVPAFIGINDGSYITELHTHSTDGVIHNESESKRTYTLGQFFAEWGVFLNRKCVGAYCHGYTWYVNGKKQTGNPANLVLKAHLEVVIAIGKPPKKIPSKFNWNGL